MEHTETPNVSDPLNVARISVNVSDWNDNTVVIPLSQLIQWKGALKLELLGLKHSRGSVAAHVRKVLSAPRHYSTRELHAYIVAVVDDVAEQLGA